MRRAARAVFGAALALIGLAMAGTLWQSAMTRLSQGRFPPPGQRLDIGGRSLHLVCAGQGTPTVVLEAGGTRGVDEYARVLPALGRHTRTCAYDRAGMGWSDPSPEPLTARRLASDLEALLEAARLPPPYVLVAASGGGVTAELFAREHPDEVGGMVLLDALDAEMVLAVEPALGRFQERRACAARALAALGLIRLLDPLGRRAELPEDEEEVALALASQGSTWDAVCSLVASRAASVAQVRAAPPLRPELPRAILVHQRAEGLTGGGPALDARIEPLWQREQARIAARTLRGARVVVEGSGHHIATERPERVVEQALALVEEIRGLR